MKCSLWLVTFGILAGSINAEMIVLEGASSTLTTGDLLDESDHTGRTTNVVEISGLQITARSGGPSQDVNALTDSMGIDSDGGDDDSGAIEDGETLILSFSRDVQINQFDFNQFSSGEVVNVSISGIGEIVILHEEQSNAITDTLNTNLVVTANSEIAFYATGASTFGLDGIDVTVLEEVSEVSLSFNVTNGVALVSALFNEPATTNYVLQSSTNIVSNSWSTVSGPFSETTNWVIETTNNAEFYRLIME